MAWIVSSSDRFYLMLYQQSTYDYSGRLITCPTMLIVQPDIIDLLDLIPRKSIAQFYPAVIFGQALKG